jgi:hypothetical protein
MITMTEAELNIIRPGHQDNRKKVFAQDPLRTKARVWTTFREVMELNDYRKARGLRLVKLSQKKQDDQEYKNKRGGAGCRHDELLEIQGNGDSFSTKYARFRLFVAQNFQWDSQANVYLGVDLAAIDVIQIIMRQRGFPVASSEEITAWVTEMKKWWY